MIRNTRHTGLVVRDLARSISFYQALGLKVWKREVETGSFIAAVVGIPDVRLEWAKLRAPDGTLVELLQYHSHPRSQPVRPAASNQLGCSHIAFTVDDLSAACALVGRLGGSMVNPPARAPGGKVRVAYCHDPDGILMELVEELDGHG
ncbi:MAG: glyoxalase [Betaproteobacteria bacterium]|nr:glyoxalase [Betaproteobacteria bacterium]